VASTCRTISSKQLISVRRPRLGFTDAWEIVLLANIRLRNGDVAGCNETSISIIHLMSILALPVYAGANAVLKTDATPQRLIL